MVTCVLNAEELYVSSWKPADRLIDSDRKALSLQEKQNAANAKEFTVGEHVLLGNKRARIAHIDSKKGTITIQFRSGKIQSVVAGYLTRQ